MRRIKKSILLVLCLFPICNVYAAGTASISANDTVVNGNNVTATVTLRNMAAWNISISGAGATNGCSVKEVGDSGNGNDTTKHFNLTCKATELGTITFSYSGDITSSDGVNKNISGSKKVTVVKPREKSSNNNLKSLSVEGYELSPGFNKNTLEYTVNIESSVEKVKINASKEDGYASIDGTGEKEVQEGDNKFSITVTSETGKSKVYSVNVVVKDSNPIVKEIDGKKYTVVKRASALTKPEFFEETTVKINELDIPAFLNEKTKITLIGLKDEEGKIVLYRYDNSKDSLEKYESLTSVSKTIIFENTSEEIKDFKKTKVTINEMEYSVYQMSTNKDFVLIYGRDIETGTKGWYLYNIKENTIQSYMNDIVSNLEDNFDKQISEYKIVLLSLAVLSLLLLLILVIEIASKSKMKKKLIRKFEERKEQIIEKEKIVEEKIKEENKEENESTTQEEVKEEPKENSKTNQKKKNGKNKK